MNFFVIMQIFISKNVLNKKKRAKCPFWTKIKHFLKIIYIGYTKKFA